MTKMPDLKSKNMKYISADESRKLNKYIYMYT
jgi:hypothetical protein